VRLLLDTHVLLWWLSDDRKLAKNAREIIAKPENDVLVSSASLWEVAIKAALGRIEVELDDLKMRLPATASGPCRSDSGMP
jgi:PIN domain nuclease of toxin-antitoxin system